MVLHANNHYVHLDWTSILAKLKHGLSTCYELLIPFLFLVLYFVYSDYQLEQRLSLAAEPKINDFLLVDYHKIDDSSDVKYRYLPLKVTQINGQELRFKIGNIAHTEPVSIKDQVKYDAPMQRNYFRAEELVLTRQQIDEMVKEGVIYDIARPKTIFIEGWIVMHLADMQPE